MSEQDRFSGLFIGAVLASLILRGCILPKRLEEQRIEITQQCDSQKTRALQSQLNQIYKEDLYVKRETANGEEYISAFVKGREVRLFNYEGQYLPLEKIRALEQEKLKREADSDLVEKLRKYELDSEEER